MRRVILLILCLPSYSWATTFHVNIDDEYIEHHTNIQNSIINAGLILTSNFYSPGGDIYIDVNFNCGCGPDAALYTTQIKQTFNLSDNIFASSFYGKTTLELNNTNADLSITLNKRWLDYLYHDDFNRSGNLPDNKIDAISMFLRSFMYGAAFYGWEQTFNSPLQTLIEDEFFIGPNAINLYEDIIPMDGFKISGEGIAGSLPLEFGIKYEISELELAFLQDVGYIFSPPIPILSGDFNLDGNVDGADFVIWQTNFPNNTGIATLDQGDANGDGNIDGADFVVWQTNFPSVLPPISQQVPESNYILPLLIVTLYYGLYTIKRSITKTS